MPYEPFSFTPRYNATITVDGRQVRLRAGVPYETNGFSDEHACEIISIVEAYLVDLERRGLETNFHETNEGVYERIIERCDGRQTQELENVDIGRDPQPLPSEPDPSPPWDDGVPPGGEDDSTTMRVPDPPTAGELAGTGDRSALTPGQRHHDPTDPESLEEIAGDVELSGASQDGVSDAAERARRNDPEPGEADPVHSRSQRSELDTTVEPVIVYTGQFELDLVDVEIASPGMPLRLSRLYRSGAVHYGPWGFQWDHNYNVYLRPLNSGAVALWTGRLHEELYLPSDTGFDPPHGVPRLLEHETANIANPERWVLSERLGQRLIFERPAGWSTPEKVPLIAIEDRNGNRHELEYDSNGKLTEVRDEDGRFIRFHYGGCELLERVEDHSGRVWTYVHDEDIEHLVAVVSPPTDEYPEGRTFRYEYDRYKSHPSLQHNLVRVVDPDDRIVVVNTYGDDPYTDDFCRVVYQEFEEFTTLFRAERLQAVRARPKNINVPALRIEVIDPGYLFIYTFNYRGDLLDKRYRLTEDGSYRLVAETFRYDPEGNLTEHYLPDGRGMLYQYDDENSDPRARNNLLRAEAIASPLKPAPSVILLQATYESKYWQLKTYKDAGEAETVFHYDYEYHPMGNGPGDLLELHRPPFTQPDGTVVTPIETFQYNSRGQLTEYSAGGATHEFTYETVGLQTGYLLERKHQSPSYTRVEQYERDNVGNITAKIDGEGNRVAYHYDAFNLLREVVKADGSVWQFGYDGAGHVSAIREPRGDYADPVLTDLHIRHEFRYNSLGYLTLATYGVNTQSPRAWQYKRNAEGRILEERDPLGQVIRRTFDERGLMLREERLDTAGATVHVRTLVYEKPGYIRSIEVEGGPKVSFEYDGFGRLFRATDPAGTSLEYDRDRRGLPTAVQILGRRVLPSATSSGLLARQRREYDEAGGLRRRVEELFDDPAGPHTDVTTEVWRNDVGQVERLALPSGLEMDYEFTAEGTIRRTTDSLGNSVSYTFDQAGRPTQIEHLEVPTTGASVTRVETVAYDAVGRVEVETDPLGNEVHYEYDARGMLRVAINPEGQEVELAYDVLGELVEQSSGGATLHWERDLLGRAIAFRDPTGTTTQLAYDALGRISSLTRMDDGAHQQYGYHPDGGLSYFEDFDGTRLEYENTAVGLPERITAYPGPGVAATAMTELGYDGLRRIVEASYGANSVERHYDSLGRLLEESGAGTVQLAYDPAGLWRTVRYPDGRRDRDTFDTLGRLSRLEVETAGSLTGAAYGTPVGTVLAELDWQGLDRAQEVRYPGELIQAREHDAGARLARLSYADASSRTLFKQELYRDRLGLVQAERREEASGSEQALQVDGLNRLTKVAGDLPGGTLPAGAPGLSQAAFDAAISAARGAPAARSTFFEWTSADTPKKRIDQDSASSTTVDYTTDSLHRVTGFGSTAVTYDGRGDVVTLGAMHFRFDAFRRVTEIHDSTGPVARFDYDGLGRVLSLEEGGTARFFSYLGDEMLEASVGGSPLLQYTPGVYLDQPFLAHSPGGTFSLLYESTGSLIAATDLSGSVMERYRYDVFGTPGILTADGSTVLARSSLGLGPRFHGRPYVADTGLCDFRTRLMSPLLMGFLQPDPFTFSGSWSHHGYAHYNPYNFADPYGEFWHIVAGAVIGAGIGAISVAVTGGDVYDVLVAAGAGAAGGALTACGMPIAGAAVAGGIMGAWSGGRIGHQMGGVGGAVIGVAGGAVVGTALGAAGGFVGSRVGNSVGTAVYGRAFNWATTRGMGARTAVTVARTSSMVTGGYAGGASAGVAGNTASTIAVDVATGQPITVEQLGEGLAKGLIIDGPLGAVGATAERMALVASIPLRTNQSWRTNIGMGRNLGMEGELLVGKAIGHDPAAQAQSVTVNGRRRYPDFRLNETSPNVVEVKNKTRLSTGPNRRSDQSQINDFADVATQSNGDVILYHRPGMDTTPVGGIQNLVPLPIPQQPLVVPVLPPRTRRREKE